MARTKSASFSLQQQAILQAAAELFAQHGFHDTSMANLANACNMSKSLLYHYYRDKAELLSAIANGYVDDLLSITESVMKTYSAESAQTQLERLIVSFMKKYEISQAQHCVLVQEVKYLDAIPARQIKNKQKKIVLHYAQLITQCNPNLAAEHLAIPLTMTLFGMINWTFTWLNTKGNICYEAMAPIIARLFFHGLQGFPPSSPAPK